MKNFVKWLLAVILAILLFANASTCTGGPALLLDAKWPIKILFGALLVGAILLFRYTIMEDIE